MIISDKNEIRFNLYVMYPLQSFEEYANYIENSFKNKLSEFEKGIQKIDDSEVDNYIDFYSDELSLFRDEFPAIMRNSLFTSIYSFLEDKLVELCIPGETDSKLSDVKGSGIQQASQYLKKVLKRDFPDQSKEWNFIKKANLVRNCIVHNGGATEKFKNPEKVKNAVAGLKHVNLNQQKKIILDEYFCLDFIQNVEALLRKLYKEE